jgi:hypothetical protein
MQAVIGGSPKLSVRANPERGSDGAGNVRADERRVDKVLGEEHAWSSPVRMLGGRET